MTIIIITPPPTKPGGREAELDGFAQERNEFDEAYDLLDEAQAAGMRVKIVRTDE